MAKIEVKFLCETLTENAWLKCEMHEEDNGNKTIKIEVNDPHSCENSSIIYLDKSTAIKLSKTLRTEINKITEREVYNG